MGKRHTVERVSTLVFLILAVALLAGFIPVRLGMLGGVAEGVMRDFGADSVSVKGVTVTLWTGVRVHDLSAYKRISDAESYRVSARYADVSVNLFRFADRLLAKSEGGVRDSVGPRDIFHEAYEAPLEFIGRLQLVNAFKTVTLHGAGVEFTSKGQPGVSASGISATVRRRSKAEKAFDGGRGGAARRNRVTLAGDIVVREVHVPSLARLENFHIKMRADGDRLDLTDGYGSVFGGRFGADFSIGLRDSRVLGGSAHVSGLDLDKFCKGTGFTPGYMSGKVSIMAAVSAESAARLDSVVAWGSVSVTRLTAEGIALQRAPAVSQALGGQQLHFSEVAGDFEMSEGRIRFAELAGAGEALKFTSAGWIGLDGRLSCDLDGEFSPQFTESLTRLVRGGLDRTEEGGGRFKCKITGTFGRPRVEVDRSVYSRAIRNIFK